MRLINVSVILLSLTTLTACVQKQTNDVYDRSEVGVSRAVEFGTVINAREVTIKADQSDQDIGTLLGAGVGGGSGAYVGDGSGNAWATVGGAVAGAFIGNEISKELRISQGFEYMVQLQSGDIKTIVQEVNEDNPVLKAGDKVMLQYCDANKHNYRCKPEKRTARDYQRLIKVDSLPSVEKKKKRKKKNIMI